MIAPVKSEVVRFVLGNAAPKSCSGSSLLSVFCLTRSWLLMGGAAGLGVVQTGTAEQREVVTGPRGGGHSGGSSDTKEM